MIKEALIDLREENIVGNILDIGGNNYGVIYNISKKNNEDIEVDYIDGNKDTIIIEENYYDCCTLFFTLNTILLKKSKRYLIHNIYKYLKEDGTIYIWDIEKRYNKTASLKIKILLTDNNIKEIKIKDYNIFKDNSKESNLKLLNDYFIVEKTLEKDGLYFIKAKKRKA